jgi:hypothetical protein
MPLVFSNHVLRHRRGKLDHQPHEGTFAFVAKLMPYTANDFSAL